MHGDARSRRLVVVPDAVLNPPPGGADYAAALAAGGWGLVVLPPTDVAGVARAAWLDAIVDEVATFLEDDYEVATVRMDDDDALAEFVEALRAAGHDLTRQLDFGQ